MSQSSKHLFCGIHVVGELYGIDPALLDDPIALERSLIRGINASGASLCGTQIKKFEPRGVTVLALLSESHTSVHTYPEQGTLFFDAFTCGTHCRPELIAQALIQDLRPEHHKFQRLVRGDQKQVPQEVICRPIDLPEMHTVL
jgi:S-adenosylmethionine decarboxylase